ncbi:hypothetical protein Pelo_6489 [Pelomyxa schiedti]|nr:hypothetical protein Pelo_6489 [Pelomyxa schiedti]
MSGSVEDCVIGLVKELVINAQGMDVTLDSNLLMDLGADSIETVKIKTRVEEMYHISIPTEDMYNVFTVGDVVNYVKSHTGRS